MARNYDYNGDPCGEYGAAVRDIELLRKELARLRITDEEREAIEIAADLIDAKTCGDPAILRGLLERFS